MSDALTGSAVPKKEFMEQEDDGPKKVTMAGANMEEEDYPKNVHSEEQLKDLPEFFLSNNPKEPLQNVDDKGNVFTYSLHPMTYSAMFILLIEGLERFSYYGLTYTQYPYLTGEYDKNWSPGMSSVEASSFTSASVAITYTSPFLGGILADGLLGDYWEIVLGISLLYIPGLLCIALTAFPGLLAEEFPMGALNAGYVVLMPLGAGAIKSVVNVFGAKQFHPYLQQTLIEQYYINFYMCINIGALFGGVIIPLISQQNPGGAFMIPVVFLALGLVVFLAGTRRYVRRPPEREALCATLSIVGQTATKCGNIDKTKISYGGKHDDEFVNGVKALFQVFPISAMILPFSIAYNQMYTVFNTQGLVMKKVAFFDASMMNNFDAISVLLAGVLIGHYFYPFLERRGIKLPITYKFAIGTFFGLVSLVTALIIDYQIHSVYKATGEMVNIMWQILPYGLIGAGEIFTFTAVYDAAFQVAPKEQKGLASAINLFFIGGVSNFICIGLYQGCAHWFAEGAGVAAYSESKVYNYLWVLIGISIFGIVINLLPPVKNYFEDVLNVRLEETANESLVLSKQSLIVNKQLYPDSPEKTAFETEP